MIHADPSPSAVLGSFLSLRRDASLGGHEPEVLVSPSAPMPCPRSEELAALVDDRLEARDRRRLLTHLLDCQRCYAAFREVILLRALPLEP